MSDEKKPRPWWRSLPAVLGAVAAVLTALTGLVTALWPYGISGPQAPHEDVAVYDSDGGMVVEVVLAEVEHVERGHWDQVEAE